MPPPQDLTSGRAAVPASRACRRPPRLRRRPRCRPQREPFVADPGKYLGVAQEDLVGHAVYGQRRGIRIDDAQAHEKARLHALARQGFEALAAPRLGRQSRVIPPRPAQPASMTTAIRSARSSHLNWQLGRLRFRSALDERADPHLPASLFDCRLHATVQSSVSAGSYF
jgi:hypothetical protein